MEAYYLTHARDAGDWRLRKFRAEGDNHPVDPNWESGRYMACHDEARSRLQGGQLLFDVVGVGGQGLVRSAFVIAKTRGEGYNRVLYFNTFWFPGSDAMMLLPTFHRTRYPVDIHQPTAEQLLGKMQRVGYREYRYGTVPVSVNRKDWNAMVREAERALGQPHRCSE